MQNDGSPNTGFKRTIAVNNVVITGDTQQRREKTTTCRVETGLRQPTRARRRSRYSRGFSWHRVPSITMPDKSIMRQWDICSTE